MSRWLHSLRQGWATIPAAHHSPARWMLPRSNLSCNAGLRFNTMCCLNCVRRESTAPDGLQKTRESERAECGPVQTEGGRLHEHVGALPGATIAGKDVRGRALGLQQATRARLSQRFARPPSISHGGPSWSGSAETAQRRHNGTFTSGAGRRTVSSAVTRRHLT